MSVPAHIPLQPVAPCATCGAPSVGSLKWFVRMDDGATKSNLKRYCGACFRLELSNATPHADGGETPVPGVDKECVGNGATHHMACKCREGYFKELSLENDRLRDVLSEALVWYSPPFSNWKIEAEDLLKNPTSPAVGKS